MVVDYSKRQSKWEPPEPNPEARYKLRMYVLQVAAAIHRLVEATIQLLLMLVVTTLAGALRRQNQGITKQHTNRKQHQQQ